MQITKEKLLARIEEIAKQQLPLYDYSPLDRCYYKEGATKMADALVLLAEAMHNQPCDSTTFSIGSNVMDRQHSNGCGKCKALTDAAKLLGLESGE